MTTVYLIEILPDFLAVLHICAFPPAMPAGSSVSICPPSTYFLVLNVYTSALVGVAWLERCLINQKVLGLIPCQGTCLWVRSPVGAHMRDHQSMVVSHIDVSLSPPRPLSLKSISMFSSENKINKYIYTHIYTHTHIYIFMRSLLL